MKVIENQRFDVERALYGINEVTLKDCSFDGPADGESALKESQNIIVDHCYFNLRYPFWHDRQLTIQNSEMTELCRASLWYSEDIQISNTKMYGIKAVRECRNIIIENCDIISPEFGWSSIGFQMKDTKAQSEYFLMRAQNVKILNVNFQGKYSFQYIENGEFENCRFDTKDAFWHARNVVIRDSVVKGEYLAWYSEGLTFINCKIIGTQPFCYCKNLKLIDCEMVNTDFCFEKSEVEATITTSVLSIKNPYAGTIVVPGVDEMILDDPYAKGKVVVNTSNGNCA